MHAPFCSGLELLHPRDLTVLVYYNVDKINLEGRLLVTWVLAGLLTALPLACCFCLLACT